MRRKIIEHLVKKELTDVIRDKKTVFAMMVLPLLMYPLMMIALSFVLQMVMEDAENERVQVVVAGEVLEGFTDFAKEYNETADFVKEAENPNYILTFHEEQLTITYDSSKDNMGMNLSEVEDLIQAFEVNQLQEVVRLEGIEVSTISQDEIIIEDTATNTMQIGKIIGQTLPLLLIVSVLLGVIYPAIDIVTGEKERNTLETLRSLPITALEIVVSKFATIVFCGIVSTVLNLVSISLSMWYFMASMSATDMGDNLLEGIQLGKMMGPLLMTLVCLLLFTFFVSATTMIVVSFAGSFKEAQNYISPLMLAVMLPAYATMIPTITLNGITSLIPIINISLLIRQAFTFELELSLVMLVIVSNLAYSIFAVLLLGKVFNREEILFGNQKSFRLLEGRKNIKVGGLPGMIDAVTIYAVALVLILYSGAIIVKVTEVIEIQLVSIQLVMFLSALLYGIYIKSDYKELFQLRRFHVKWLFIGLPLMVLGFLITLNLHQVLIDMIPALEVLLEQMNQVLDFDNMVIFVLVVAVAPAICEELLFRGFILTGLQVQKHPIVAILVSSLLFGIMHMNVFQLITGMILGSVLGYVTYKSKSIYPAMILHFTNNLIGIVLSQLS